MATIIDLPVEVLRILVDYLNYKDVINLSSTCKYAITFIGDEQWKTMYFNHWSLTNTKRYLANCSWKLNFSYLFQSSKRWRNGKYEVKRVKPGRVTTISIIGPYILIALCKDDGLGYLSLWEGGNEISSVQAHNELIWWFSVADNDLCVSCCNEGYICVTDIEGSNLNIRYKLFLQEKALWCVDVSKKLDIIAAGSNSTHLYVVKLSTQQILHQFSITSGFFDVTIVGDYVIGCPTGSPSMLLYHHETGEKFEWLTPRGRSGIFINVTHPISHNTLIAADTQGNVTEFDVSTRTALWTLTASPDTGVSVSDVIVWNGAIYAAVNSTGVSSKGGSACVRVFDYKTKEHLYDVPMTRDFVSRLYAMAVSPDKIVVGLGDDGMFVVQLVKEEESMFDKCCVM